MYGEILEPEISSTAQEGTMQTTMQETLVDYSDFFAHAMIAQGLGSNVLVLEKLDTPHGRFDGKRVSWLLEYRWLSRPCGTPTDQSWCCVTGSEFSYWSHRELRELGVINAKGNLKTDNLFGQFNLF